MCICSADKLVGRSSCAGQIWRTFAVVVDFDAMVSYGKIWCFTILFCVCTTLRKY